MNHFTLDDFRKLAQKHQPHCVSIFIPTHRVGQQVKQGHDQLVLKNKLKAARQQLAEYKLSDREIDALLKPADALLSNGSFWSNRSDGLALFISPGEFLFYSLPVSFDAFLFVDTHYYLMPLIPYLNHEGHFYLLALSLNKVKLYEGTPHHLDEIEEAVHHLPSGMDEVLGDDSPQRNLQFRSQQGGGEHAMYHGHGAGKEDAKAEAMKYFRAVNDGLMKMLRDEKVPLVIAAVEYLIPIYAEANGYKYLWEKSVTGNPEHEDLTTLHRKAWELLANHFDSERSEKSGLFEEVLANKRAAYKMEEVVRAAINKRVDTLFVSKGEEVWGTFDRKENEIRIESKKEEHNTGLLNLAATYTLLNGGRVFMMPPDKMPESTSKLNALLRY
ncbi:MAG TPA: hypothetical protein VFC92_09065 [Bacteroidales bacterium]|nr:hypothetical protein [Bacteroidales bacterium]